MNKAHVRISLITLLLVFQALFSNETIGKEVTQKGLKSSDKYKKYIENTTWIVPPTTLLAYQYLDGISVPVTDQTVWVINTFDEGYFFGDSYTSINGEPSSHKKLVGSITPCGDVYITFFSTTGDLLSTDVVTGIGKFTKDNEKYYFIMQMNSAQNSAQGLSHWSYMISVEPTDFFLPILAG